MVKAATASELRTKKTKELIAQVGELRTELLALRVAQVSNGAASKLAKISVVRKSIARVLTVINAKARTEMRNQVKGKRTVQASGPRAAPRRAAPSSPRRAASHHRALRARSPPRNPSERRSRSSCARRRRAPSGAA
jgi:ribosomal protein L29